MYIHPGVFIFHMLLIICEFIHPNRGYKNTSALKYAIYKTSLDSSSQNPLKVIWAQVIT